MTHQTVNLSLETCGRTMGKQQHVDNSATMRNEVKSICLALFKKHIPWYNCEPLYANLYNLGHQQKNGFQDSWMDEAVSLKTYSMLPQPVKAEEGKL